jgi:hypothetical protein
MSSNFALELDGLDGGQPVEKQCLDINSARDAKRRDFKIQEIAQLS